MSYTGGGLDTRVRNLLLQAPEPAGGPLLWLSGASISVANGSPIDVWPDRSGRGNNATASGAQRPLFSRASAINNQPAAVFSGATFFDLPAGFADFSAGLTVYIVHSPVDTDAVAKSMLGVSDNGVASAYSFIIDTSNEAAAIVALAPGFEFVANVGVQPYAANVYEARMLGGQGQVFVNHVQVAAGPITAPAVTARNLNYVGNDAIGGIFPYAGLIAEILLYARVLTAAERAAVDAYLKYVYKL